MSRVVLVTGASSGIGRAVAKLLAQEGYIVYGASRSGNGERIDSLTNIQMDVTNRDSIVKVLTDIKEQHGALYAVVNSAGLGMVGAIEDSSSEELEELFRTNLMGVHEVCRQSISMLRNSSRSYIVNITSIAAQMGLPYRGLYCASKFAVEGYSESLSHEVSTDGIRVVLVEPGDVKTSINENRRQPNSVSQRNVSTHNAIRDQVNREVDGGMEPEEIARVISRILRSDNPKLRYRVARPQARLAYYFMRLLPDRWFEHIIQKHYKIK